MKIYVFGRGHVVIAPIVKVQEVDGFDAFPLKTGYTIRKWGTSHGIGQLATGPTKETIIDAIPYGMNVPVGALHTTVNLSEDKKSLEKWEDAFKKADSEFLKA